MIFYFSGTGNSLYVAKQIAEFNKEHIVSISCAAGNSSDSIYEYNLRENEKIGIVFPVYAWAPPKIVENFLKRIKFNNYHSNYYFAVGVCGDSAGKAVDRVKDILEQSNIKLSSGFTIMMPNNYIVMFDTDDKKLEKRKLEEAESTILKINNIIKNEEQHYVNAAGIKNAFMTDIIGSAFNKFGINNCKNFYAEDYCTGCGICARICPKNNITVRGKPSWGNECTQCAACIHWCPVRAVQFNRSTAKKGRYTNPNIRVEEMFCR